MLYDHATLHKDCARALSFFVLYQHYTNHVQNQLHAVINSFWVEQKQGTDMLGGLNTEHLTLSVFQCMCRSMLEAQEFWISRS